MSDNDELGSGQIAAPCTFRREGRRADVRCKREIERNARRKRTLRASASFFRCANAANGGSELKPTDDAVRRNGRVPEPEARWLPNDCPTSHLSDLKNCCHRVSWIAIGQSQS